TLADRLLSWFATARRHLPWRKEPRDPYRVWVSEVMLQQTRVDVVVPYYRRFLRRFPTLEALAAAPLDDVLALWSGLGYYARARNLHRAARACGGALPSTSAELRALPGFGPYTAAAVASLAFGADVPLVDGNVARVLARRPAEALFGGLWDLPVERPEGIRILGRMTSLGVVEETLTHREVRVTLQTARASGTPRSPDVRWVAPAGIVALGVSSLARK